MSSNSIFNNFKSQVFKYQHGINGNEFKSEHRF